MRNIYKTLVIILFSILLLFPTIANASTVIENGANGTYTKTASVDTLNTTIPFAVSGATSLNVLIDNPDTYIAFDETNISTYPTPSRWLFVWPLNGNILDISGNERNGAAVGVTSTAGRSGTAGTGYYYDGNNDYIYYDYADTLYSTNTLFVGYKLNHTTSDSNHVVADFRNPSGVGRTGMYEYENTYYVNNATSTTTLNSTTNQGWKYACYPFSPAQINYIWLGNRYNLLYDFRGWIDVAGLYNGTLSADQRRVFSYGYQGITVAPYPTTSRTPIRSSNQAVTPASSITGVNVKSPTSTTESVTLTANLRQNFTVVRDVSNTTLRNVDTVFIAGSNVTSCILEYTLSDSYNMGTPALSTNATGASVEIDGDRLLIHTGALTAGESRYYNVTMSVTAGTPYMQVTNWNASNASCIALLHITNLSSDYVWDIVLNDTTPGYYYSIVNVDTGYTLSSVVATTNATFSITGLTGSVTLKLAQPAEVPVVPAEIIITEWDPTNASCMGLIHISHSAFEDVWTILLNDTIFGMNYTLVNADTNETVSEKTAGDTVTFQIDGISGSILLKITRIHDITTLSYSPSDTTLVIKNDTIQQFKVTYSSPVITEWVLNNITVQTDSNYNVTAYWLNASDIGIHNVTARADDDSQIVWNVNVTSTPNPGSGDFVVAGIAVSVVVAAGYLYTKFRRRF